jgi:hypothetical protein
MEGARPVLDIPPLAQSRRSISSANPSITFLSCLLVSELISSLKFADMDSQLYRLQLHHNGKGVSSSSDKSASSSRKTVSTAPGSGVGASQASPASAWTTNQELYWAVPTVGFGSSGCPAHGSAVCIDCRSGF